MGLLDKFKKEKVQPPVPQPENNSKEEKENTTDFSKLDDVPQREDFGGNLMQKKQNPKTEQDKLQEKGNPEMPKTELPEMEAPEANNFEDKELSLPSFDEKNESQIPEKVPFDDILAGTDKPLKKENLESKEEKDMESEEKKPEEKEDNASSMKQPRDKIFVKASKYKTILNDFDVVKKELKDSKELINKLTEESKSNDDELKTIDKNLNSIQESLLDLDLQIFKN